MTVAKKEDESGDMFMMVKEIVVVMIDIIGWYYKWIIIYKIFYETSWIKNIFQ
jgi:hypothetical protein